MWNYQANMADLAISALHHHNIVQLFNIVHEHDNTLSLVFEFLDLDLEKYMEALTIFYGDRGKNFLKAYVWDGLVDF